MICLPRRLSTATSEHGQNWEYGQRFMIVCGLVPKSRTALPTGAIVDSQSVKTTDVGGPGRGFDGGKKVSGHKRHILVETLNLVLTVLVHGANVADVTEGRMLLAESSLSVPTIQQVWADGGYPGQRLEQVAIGCNIQLSVVQRTHCGFEVMPRRWVVEHTFAWLGRQPRLSKDYERLPEVSESVVHMAMIARYIESSRCLIIYLYISSRGPARVTRFRLTQKMI
jgi:transposase